MLFNSYIFIFLFFPLCLAGYFALNHHNKYDLAQAFLLGMSLWFYGYFNPSYLAIMLVSIVLNYAATRLMAKCADQRRRKALLVGALVLNLGILFYYKYFDFFITNVNALFGTNLPLLRILLPLGISFFTFQQVSYVIDAYRGEVAQYSFLYYASFVAYFPQLIAGPIVTHDELIPQFLDVSRRKFNWDNFAPGLFIFVLGLAKKVLLADVFGQVADWGFGSIGDLDATNAVLVVLAYTFQVYFDFSGYCDMAIGLGKMMNIDLPLNFDSPYKSLTITEFWQRWHKTLTRFFTKYIYIPLGGNRKGKLRTYLHVLVVYLVSGIWHGANWTFIAWGCIHGVGSVLTRHRKDKIARLPRVVQWLATFAFLCVTWIFFRAGSLSEAVNMLSRILTLDFGPVNDYITGVFQLKEIVYPISWVFHFSIPRQCPHLMTVIFYVGTLLLAVFAPNAYQKMKTFDGGILSMLVISALAVWCIFSLAGVSTFLYFNF